MSRSPKSVVLVVDDVTENIKLMRAVLVPAGYEVISATDGPTALQMVQTLQPHLILLDVSMPNMDGYAVCSRLKEDESTRHIPVIFVTGKEDADAEARGFAVGAADYITKPIKLPVVRARVKTHLALYGQRRSLEGMFRDVIEFAPDAFILSNTQGHIIQINGRAEQLFGYKRAELIGLPVALLIPQRSRSAHEGDLRAYLQQPHGMLTDIGIHGLRRDGTEFPADISLSPMETNRGQLLMAVVRDVTERQKAEMELNESRQRLRDLAAQNETQREEERKHIAREVHDELGQVLTALRMDISLLGMQFGSQNAALLEKVQGMKRLVDLAIQGVRNVVVNLRPTALDMGLVPAIEWLCRDFTERTSMPCVLQAQEEEIDLDETRAVVIFRIVQESLTNITRYAEASRVDINLGRRGNELGVEVRDNGRGFDLAAVDRKNSFGLLGMRERALALGGRVDIASAPGQGTVIGVTIPIDLTTAKDKP